jgi:hypothetical protein
MSYGAERGVAKINIFNDTLTRDKETEQALLQVGEYHSRLHPSSPPPSNDIYEICDAENYLDINVNEPLRLKTAKKQTVMVYARRVVRYTLITVFSL